MFLKAEYYTTTYNSPPKTEQPTSRNTLTQNGIRKAGP